MTATVSGWVTKEGGSYKNWKKRWMIIEGTDLAYYKKENKKEKCGIVPLVGSMVSTVSYKQKKFCFEITTPTRTWHVCANSESDMDRWIKGLNDAIKLGSTLGGVSSSSQGKLNESSSSIPPAGSEGGKDVKKMGIEDFTIKKVIGQGSFGKVLLVTKKEEPNKDRVFAMKVLNKSTIIARNEVEHTKSEKSILMKLEHPFLVQLHYSFQTPDKLYFIMDYINGGELFFHLQRDKKFPEERVRYYAAEIVSGLEYLHTNGVIYRDLKPENLLVTREGHIVMTDFGLSKEGLFEKDDRTGTFCGTPEYLAPEVLEGKGYGKAVDWWSFGTLVYEMLTGLPPFYCEDVQEMYTRIMTAELEVPASMSPPAADLLSKLLDRNDETRLQEPAEIKSHPFFAPIDFELLIQKKIPPPYIPEVTSDDDIRNIDRNFTDAPVDVPDEDETAIPESSQGEFEGFTYNPNAPKNNH
eukprot:TRINITY_DN3554_c0_g1_i1.p1 TRINITY_DN3554_c0_g1~~TRINITY_DN3554_c0_g1_i1.p1  ORF type:complete len:485 (+),score=97.92 TRINITY_DN3554_c0_g1_i1:57-1457(+)